MKEKFKNRNLIIAIIFCLVFVLLCYLDLYKCPLKYFFGIPCPTCGMTRACLSVLKGNIAKSFYYYPLWPVLVIGIISHILIELNIIKTSHKWNMAALIGIGIAIAICFVLRHLTHSPIVEIHFHKSLIYRLYQMLSSFL